jgi:FemAB-related protein (PEP-CTERM system-associated)
VETATLQATQAETTSPSLTVRTYRASDASAWDALVQRSSSGTFCHLTGWGQVIARVWNHRSHHLVVEDQGEIKGVLPLFHVKSRAFGSMLISTPNGVYGGVVADEAQAGRALLDEAKKLATQLQVDFLELRHALADNEIVDPDLQRKDLYFTFEHPISTDEDALMKSFPRDVRTMIRKGSKNELTSQLGRAELLDEFYDVYATSVRNLGTPVFPKRLFSEFLREFPTASDILLIRQGNRVAGGVLSFYFRDTVMPYYGGAYSEFYRAGINNFMYWELMRAAAARGFTRFDFGRSKIGTGAYEFKRGWGMQMQALPYQFYLVRASEMPNLNPTNPRYELMINVWKRLPLGVTKVLGPRIVKYLP